MRATTIEGLLVAATVFYSAIPSPAASTARFVSARDSSVTQPAGGNGNSVAPAISADGRYVLFVSSANNLTAADNSQPGLDVFLRDRASNTTVLVSANLSETGGGNGSSRFPNLSTNGRYVVFESEASDLVAGDTNGLSDIFVRDLQSGTTRLVSVAAAGGPGNGPSTEAVMTPDGRYVAFVSAATNLVAGDTNKIADVFVRDLLTETTLLASVGATLPTGASTAMVSSLSITPDGRYVAFFSNARGLATGVGTNTVGQVYVRDLVAGSTIWASTNGAAIAQAALGLQNVPSYHPVLSDDGRFVAFKTGSTNNAGGGTVVLQYDALSNSTVVVSTSGVPAWAFGDDVFGPEMTPDGRFVAFAQREGPTNTLHSSVRLWDGQTGTNILASSDGGGNVPTNTLAHTPTLTPGGRFVAFLCDATNLTGNAVSSGLHLYLRDMVGGTTQLVDADTNGLGSTDDSGAVPSLSTDGRFVAFSSPDGSLVASDNNGFLDVFLRDVTNATMELISQRSSAVVPQTGDRLSTLSQFSISADGRWVAFASAADDLVPNDANQAMDVFVRDLAAGTDVLVSVGTNGLPGSAGDSSGAVISANGRFVVFVSSATNLVASPIPSWFWFRHPNNLYRRDLQTGSTVMVTVSPDNLSAGNLDSTAPVISQDGRYVAFFSNAGNLVPGTSSSSNTFWRDIDLGLTVALTTNGASALRPSMSADGRYVAYFSATSTVSIWDAQAGTNVFATSSGVGSAAISPTGAQLAYQSSGQLFIADVAGRSNRFSFTSAVPIRSSAQWSADGRFLAFVSGANLAASDHNGTNDVYLCDTTNGTLTLASVNFTGTNSGSGLSDWPVVSGDGRFVAYRSFATNIVAGVTDTPSLYFFSRVTGSNAALSTTQSVPNWLFWVATPAISADGGRVSFQSWAANLAPTDLNRVQDVFAAAVDSDGDGIPDWWMLQYFGHSTGQAGDLSRAQDDHDGDGMTNLQEFLAGTDPTNPGSVLRVQISIVTSTNGIVLSWPASASRSYRVQFKNDLKDAAWVDSSGQVSVSAGQGQFSAPASQTSRYYRVVASD